jgi:hypothetical protein
VQVAGAVLARVHDRVGHGAMAERAVGEELGLLRARRGSEQQEREEREAGGHGPGR